MKSVLIVEDEKMIRRGIKTMIQRSGVPIEVIIECSNGEVALEILKEQEIDVMLTDIRMPKMDGITLVKQMQMLKHIPLTVAISGYDEFSYAVEMMSLGVREYILKPLDRDKIKEVLLKLENELEKGRKINNDIRQIGYQQLKYLLLSKETSQIDTILQTDNFVQYFNNDKYRICCIEDIGEMESDENYILLTGIENSSVFIVKEHNTDLLLKNELIFSKAGISSEHQSIFELTQAYEEALQMRKIAFCENIPYIIYGEDRVEKTDYAAVSEKLTSSESILQRVQVLGTDKSEEVTGVWNRFFVEVKRGNIHWDMFKNSIEEFLIEVQKTYKNIIEDNVKPEELKNILSYSSIDAYEEDFMEWILGLHGKINSQFLINKSKQKIMEAIDYINKNYAKNLNMAVVSNHISMNYSLFSYSFKLYTGSNFVNYLKDIRIKEAQRLLKETDLRVNEISQAIGYDNDKHFMKLFKSTCGVSPSEYRKNMQH